MPPFDTSNTATARETVLSWQGRPLILEDGPELCVMFERFYTDTSDKKTPKIRELKEPVRPLPPRIVIKRDQKNIIRGFELYYGEKIADEHAFPVMRREEKEEYIFNYEEMKMNKYRRKLSQYAKDLKRYREGVRKEVEITFPVGGGRQESGHLNGGQRDSVHNPNDNGVDEDSFKLNVEHKVPKGNSK